MGRKKKPEQDDKEQSARFIELARQIEGNTDKETFDRKFSNILKAKKPIKPKKE